VVAEAGSPSMLTKTARLAVASAKEPHEDGMPSGLQQRSTVQGLTKAIKQAYSPWQQQDELLRSKMEALSLANVAGIAKTQSSGSGESSSKSSTSVSKEVAMNATQNYLKAVNLAAQGQRKPYLYSTFLDDCEEPFEVADPVGLTVHTSREGLVDLIDTWPPFTLETHAVTLAQDYSYTAAFSTMIFDEFIVNRTDFLRIHSDGSVRSTKVYWSQDVVPQTGLESSGPDDPFGPRDPFTELSQDITCVGTMHRYFTALNELGTLQSYDYFDQFSPESFEVHDPFGTPPLRSVGALQKYIPELAKTLAPNGFTVSVKGVAVTADPFKCSAHIKLNIIDGPSVDIIDIFDVTNPDGGTSTVGTLKAIWHIPGMD